MHKVNTLNIKFQCIDFNGSMFLLVLLFSGIVKEVIGQFVDKPTRGQSSHGLVNSQTSQLAEMSDIKFLQ